jgi:hypothetical protein
MEQDNEIAPPPTDSSQHPEPINKIPPPPSDADINAIVAAQLKSEPLMNVDLSFTSFDNWERVDKIADYLVANNNDNSNPLKGDLLFCYQLLQKANFENEKLRRKIKDLVHIYVKSKLLAARDNLAGRFM